MIRSTLWIILAVVVAGWIELPGATGSDATPTASPVASPIVANGCAGLEPFFRAVAALTTVSDGLAIMERAGHDVLALDDDQAATVVADLDSLIAEIGALAVPEPAIAWRAAYLDLLRWYRDMAAASDPLELQQVVNDDRRLFVNLGTAVFQGQVACPGEWDRAWSVTFGE